jgi:hypothetical protein
MSLDLGLFEHEYITISVFYSVSAGKSAGEITISGLKDGALFEGLVLHILDELV